MTAKGLPSITALSVLENGLVPFVLDLRLLYQIGLCVIHTNHTPIR